MGVSEEAVGSGNGSSCPNPARGCAIVVLKTGVRSDGKVGQRFFPQNDNGQLGGRGTAQSPGC